MTQSIIDNDVKLKRYSALKLEINKFIATRNLIAINLFISCLKV
ncbi:hypothetical protein LDVICp167 [lymphocystis disease virus-China]|uniref:Uncharacterized protein n=1 Tax=lymphocystis disease virus-China TaxID=256729 RepID=Q677U5_9VIRU|nr:hypothetical protein LDVICp167 [lymphocystis disease virus-China]AAU11012.1 hypothetical protein [lymphocystis disease virus-China]